jgi:hypothetical protein
MTWRLCDNSFSSFVQRAADPKILDESSARQKRALSTALFRRGEVPLTLK